MANEYKTVIKDKKAEAKKLMTNEQLKSCNAAIHTASVAAGVEGAIPIPGVDAVPISLTQIAMVVALGKIFDKELTDSTAKALLGAAASTFVGRSLVKLIPIAGWAASATVAAGVTEAVGWMVAVDFAKTYQKTDKSDAEHIVNDERIMPDDLDEESSNTEENRDTKEHEAERKDAGQDKDEEDDESMAKNWKKRF